MSPKAVCITVCKPSGVRMLSQRDFEVTQFVNIEIDLHQIMPSPFQWYHDFSFAVPNWL